MRNSKGAFGRIDGEYDYFVGETTCPTWLDSFARKLASEPEAPKTAVEAARERNENVYQQMSAIMNKNGPKFSSVEEVVADYRKRTGMEVQAKNKLASIASSIVRASEEEGSKKKVLMM